MDQWHRFIRTIHVTGLLLLVCLAGTSPAFADSADVVALAKGHPIQLAIVILACLGIGALGAALQQQQLAGYVAALVATAAFLPGAAALTTVIIYLAEWAGRYAPLWGSVIAVGAWLVAATLCRGFADAKHAIPSSFGELRQRLDQLDAGLKVVCPTTGFPNDLCRTIACQEARDQKDQIEKDFNRKGLPWALGRGYINVWERLHRAEESLIEVAPQETVLAGALYDEFRLQGSNIDNCDDLLTRLRKAVNVLDPGATQYLKTSAPVTAPLVITTPSPLADGHVAAGYSQELSATGGTLPYSWHVNPDDLPDGLALSSAGVLSGTPTVSKTCNFTVRVTDSANLMTEKLLILKVNAQSQQRQIGAQVAAPTTSAATPGRNTEPKTLARAVLRTVRRSINEFRDGRWNGLTVARNRLLATMIFTGLTAYALLAIAIITGAPRSTVVAASAFYLVGATVGLCGRLRGESQTESAVEDYGLSTARLITIPLFCGLAAIGGVVLVAMLPFASTVFGPTAQVSSALAISATSPLPEGTAATAYSQKLEATGGTPPYSWTISEGAMPGGLELSAAGVLSGKPTSAGSGKFTVQVADSAGASTKKSFTLTINQPGQPTTAPATGVAAKLATGARIPSLEEVFDLSKNLVGLFVAAVFGLTPGLLFDRLQQQAEKYKADLRSSQSTQGGRQT